jgi:hypothetical protein
MNAEFWLGASALGNQSLVLLARQLNIEETIVILKDIRNRTFIPTSNKGNVENEMHIPGAQLYTKVTSNSSIRGLVYLWRESCP